MLDILEGSLFDLFLDYLDALDVDTDRLLQVFVMTLHVLID